MFYANLKFDVLYMYIYMFQSQNWTKLFYKSTLL